MGASVMSIDRKTQGLTRPKVGSRLCPLCGGSKGATAKACYGCNQVIWLYQGYNKRELGDKLLAARLRVRRIEEALR